MEEMRQLIGKRQGEGTPRRVAGSLFDTHTPKATTPTPTPAPIISADFTRSIETWVLDVDEDLTRALSSQDELQLELKRLAVNFKEVCKSISNAQIKI